MTETLEVDETILALMPSTTMATGNATVVVATLPFLFFGRVRLFSGVDLVISEKSGCNLYRFEGVIWSVGFQAHASDWFRVSKKNYTNSIVSPVFETNKRFLPVLGAAEVSTTLALFLTSVIRGANCDDLFAEELLYRILDFQLVSARINLEHILIVDLRKESRLPRLAERYR